MLQRVGPLAEFPHGLAIQVRIADREMVVVRWRDEFFVLRNICPHQSQAFMPAKVHGILCGSNRVGDIELNEEQPVIVCPWHTWEFTLRDGKSVMDPSKRVRSYPVEIRDDSLFIDVEPSARRDSDVK